MNTDACIIADPALAQGHMHGFSASGALIVKIEQLPNFKRTLGTSDDETRVTLWKVSPEFARQCRAVSIWRASGYYCDGLRQ